MSVEPQPTADLAFSPRPDDPGAVDRLLPVVYEELRRIAHRQLLSERSDHTLNTTGLVHEAYLRLAAPRGIEWSDRSHFFAVASRAMRRVLIDHARRYHASKRGGTRVRIPLDDANLAVEERAEGLLALDEALERLARLDPRQSRVVECRFFGGMTEEETAAALGVTPRTVRRDWVKAKGWLYQELYDPGR
ncbi:MAG TPA: sigma-70 family RNA polymerase sigma factor [Longimicrobiaceae bacterium]